MNTHLPIPQRTGNARGFTLIELLIVITIIAILAGMAFPVTNRVINQARKAECNQMISNLETAIKGYQLEYGHIPLNGGASADVYDSPTDSPGAGLELLKCLMGLPSVGYTNPRQRVFFEPKYSDSGRGGVVIDAMGVPTGLFDPWGGPYLISLDADFDKNLLDRETTTATLRKDVLIYSPGPDNNPAVWNDNLMSWK